MIPISYDVFVFKEGNVYVAYCPELDISSGGLTIGSAKAMLKEAVRLFIEEAENMGTLEDILEESNYVKDKRGRWVPPELVATELVSIM